MLKKPQYYLSAALQSDVCLLEPVFYVMRMVSLYSRRDDGLRDVGVGMDVGLQRVEHSETAERVERWWINGLVTF